MVHIATRKVIADVIRDGYYVAHLPVVEPEEAVRFVLGVGRSLGSLYVPAGCDPSEPIIRTAPTHARRTAPFDRPEAIGWHSDFASYENRPDLSLVYITRPDPRGGDFGAWRLASVAKVLTVLRATNEGRVSFDLLSNELLPFSYADGEVPRWFKVIDTRSERVFGIRFYLSSIRRGCIAEYGEVPSQITSALAVLEAAANCVGEVVRTQAGSLLVASNWTALHDRVRQTAGRTRPNREALLCFVNTGTVDKGSVTANPNYSPAE